MDWEDDDVRHWLGEDTTQTATAAAPGDDDVASLLAWDVDAVALALASLPLHELLGIPEDRAREAAVSYAKDTAAFVAAMQEVKRQEQPGNSGVDGAQQAGGGQRRSADASAPTAASHVDAPTQPPPGATPAASSSTSRVHASPLPPQQPGMSIGIAMPPPALQAQPPGDDGEDDDFLNEMLGKK